MEEKIVMLVLCRRVLANLFIEHIQNNSQMEAVGVYDFKNVKNMALIRQPTLALVEIPERQGDPAQEALDVCKDIREVCPGCKVMLMCPEKDNKCIEVCVEEKKKGEIEDFVFYDTTPEYLAKKLEAMLPV